MPKVTSKLQLTVPRAIADQYGIRPGDELQWIAAGEAIRVIPAEKINLNGQERTVKERLELFDQATSGKNVGTRKRATYFRRQRVAGSERSCMLAASLIDTNVH